MAFCLQTTLLARNRIAPVQQIKIRGNVCAQIAVSEEAFLTLLTQRNSDDSFVCTVLVCEIQGGKRGRKQIE
jgi:hypothetical protein